MKELDKRYNFKEMDQKWAKLWVEKNCFHAQANPHKKPYTIVIPPPNVTGILHMGHALNNTLQDIIIRYKRMSGFEALWMPGTDHAGIATQNVVEKQLAKEKKTRHDIGREEMIKRLWKWKQENGDTIIHQLKQLGASCDWDRTTFTMDENYSYAVRLVFVELFKKGLIYQGEKIINWCPRCQTALSDEEAEHEEKQGTLTFIRYPLEDNPKEFITVATTRPETMLGDTAVAVNPNDSRYKKFIGKTLILPLMNREIPVISDELVDPQFGTGAVKVTPAHDPNDFDMGRRHNLPFINIMHPNGVINEKGGEFNGLDRFEARKRVVELLKAKDLLEKQDPHTHAVGHCYRCNTVVEPYLSKQWFVKMKPLAEPAIKVVQEGKIKIYPERWNKVYMNWMENIRDWCISRQIWWGHRIPVWYDENGNAFAALDEAGAKEQARKKHGKDVLLKQDPDVLDTWFSSWLWPFATLNWPNDNKDLKYFYPTSALMTASEIIFFWVARMIMAGLEFMKDVPFSDVYIHGTVRDMQGKKMSKSLGNAIDPLEIINEYGADALRFSLILNSGQDLYISKEKFETGRNFANKIWNASRLILLNIENIDESFNIEKIKTADLSTQWIVSRFYSTLDEVSAAIEAFKYSEAENLIYEFFWNNFCDWHLEIIKDKWKDPLTSQVTIWLLINSLKMMHPFIPFVTEEIWNQIYPNKDPLCIQPWPQAHKNLINKKIEEEMQTAIDVVTNVRNIRGQWNIKPSDKITCFFITESKTDIDLLKRNEALISNRAGISKMIIDRQLKDTKNTATAVVGKLQCVVPLGDVVDIEKEKKKLAAQIESQQKVFDNLSNRLNNPAFAEKAPEEIINKEKAKLEHINNELQQLKNVYSSLG